MQEAESDVEITLWKFYNMHLWNRWSFVLIWVLYLSVHIHNCGSKRKATYRSAEKYNLSPGDTHTHLHSRTKCSWIFADTFIQHVTRWCSRHFFSGVGGKAPQEAFKNKCCGHLHSHVPLQQIISTIIQDSNVCVKKMAFSELWAC